MIEIVLIRHSITTGNLQGRYIGSRTDEPLCADGIALLQNFVYPFVERVYVSPMRRCMETAEYIWPELAGDMIQVSDFRECDFGIFENKNYQELSGTPEYQVWIDSNGKLPFPEGESSEQFKKRCQDAFDNILEQERKKTEKVRIGMVVHGGTIMSVMERYGEPGKNYYDYQVKNGCGYLLTFGKENEFLSYECILPNRL